MFSLPLRDDARLSELEVWHAEEFAAHMDRAREHIRPWVGPAFVTGDVAGARATLQRYAERRAHDGARLYGIWRNGVLVGGVMFVAFDAAAGTCEIGCWLEPAAEGYGLITRACDALLDWAFTTRGLHRAEWHCRADNDRSSAVAKRLGMTLEGVRREAWKYDGARHDKQLWAILAPERQRAEPAPGRPRGHDPVERVRAALRRSGATEEVVELPAEARTAAAAAEQVGCPVGAIANSLIFSVDGEPLLVVTSGAHRVDTRLVARLLGVARSRIRRADPAFVLAATGQEVGGVAPVGHPRPLRTLVDTALEEHGQIWAGGGMPHTLFPTTFEQLLSLTGGEAAVVA